MISEGIILTTRYEINELIVIFICMHFLNFEYRTQPCMTIYQSKKIFSITEDCMGCQSMIFWNSGHF